MFTNYNFILKNVVRQKKFDRYINVFIKDKDETETDSNPPISFQTLSCVQQTLTQAE
jgi:hypothetical protein